MSPLIINRVVKEVDTILVGLEALKFRFRVWTPENDPGEYLSRIKAAEFLGISYRAVGILTKSGILKSHYELSQVIYFRSELLQALRDNATWKQKKRIRTRYESSHFSGDSLKLK